VGQATPSLLCSLIHKFGRKDVDDFDAFDGRENGTIFCETDEKEMGKLQR
jgi:type I restriction enzyme R subunit